MPKNKANKLKPTAKPVAKAGPAAKTTYIPPNLLLPASKVSNKKHHVEEIIPGFIWVVHDFFSQQECQAWIDFVEQPKRLEYVQHPATKYIANRECFRFQQNDHGISDTLFQRMQGCGVLEEVQAGGEIPPSSNSSRLPTACNPNIRLYKYEKGMSFGKHIDESNSVLGVGRTEVTVLVYLSDCQGGATRFYPRHSAKRAAQSVTFAPKQGAMLLHIHGDRCLEHEADPVLQGLKYILRTDIVYSD